MNMDADLEKIEEMLRSKHLAVLDILKGLTVAQALAVLDIVKEDFTANAVI